MPNTPIRKFALLFAFGVIAIAAWRWPEAAAAAVAGAFGLIATLLGCPGGVCS